MAQHNNQSSFRDRLATLLGWSPEPSVPVPPAILQDLRDVPSLPVARFPLLYHPKHYSEINYERLPPLEQYRSMQLAAPEPFHHPATPLRVLATAIGTIPLALKLVLLLLLVLPVIPLPVLIRYLLPATALLSLILFARLLFRRQPLTMPHAVAVLFGPPLGLYALYYLSYALLHRYWFSLGLAVFTFLAFCWWGKEPILFYHRWLLTHPRVDPQRAAVKFRAARPSLFLLALVLIATSGLPYVRPSVRMLAVVGLLLLWTLPSFCPGSRFSYRRWTTTARDVLSLFLGYGHDSTFAPGLWIPQSLPARRWHYLLLSGCLGITLGLSLYIFCPYDLFEPRLAATFCRLTGQAGWRPTLEYLTPYVDWKSLPHYAPVASEYKPPERFLKALVERYPPDERKAKLNDATREYQEEMQRRGQVRHARAATAFLHRYIDEVPHLWALVALLGILSGEFFYLWTIPLVLALAIFFTLQVLLAVYRAPLLALHRFHHDLDAELAADPRTEWECYVQRVRTSAHTATDPMGGTVREADHLFLGFERTLSFPVLLHSKILSHHCYIVGQTGSGKTSQGIIPLLLQLIRDYTPADPHQASDGEPPRTTMPPMVILDLKGDPALFHTLKHEVEARAVAEHRDPQDAFKFFTPEQGKASYFFNPFQSFATANRSLIQLCNLILDSLSLNHGEGYGRAYYSRKSRAMLLKALEKKPQSFPELYDELLRMQKRSKTEFQDAYELVSTIHALTYYPQLTLLDTTPPERSIVMPRLIEERQVAYFWLSAALESISVREIAKLALHALFTAAIDRQRAGKQPIQIYLIVDEFQRIAAENFKIILEQARSYGISAILANQTQADLVTADADLRPTISTNTRTKIFFTASDPTEARFLSEASGEELAVMGGEGLIEPPDDNQRSSGTTNDGFRRFWRETMKPRLTRNDIYAISDHPLDMILQVTRGQGYTQFSGLPQVVRTLWPLSLETYTQRQSAPWPTLEESPPQAATVNPQTPREIDQATESVLTDIMLRANELADDFPELKG